MQEKLLIVDDEPDIVQMLELFFRKKGYLVWTANNGRDAIKLAEKAPDLILLDINMPDVDGLEVCRQIRNFVMCPILFLTARIEDSDKVQGFAAGGDDYILKPFSMVELEVRVAAHLRRERRRRRESRIRFAKGIVIDYGERSVYYEDTLLSFPKKEYDMIALLSQNPGQVFDKERIYEKIWGYDSLGDSAVVAEHIRRIRAIWAKAGCEDPIQTVWGCGYKWVM